MYGHHWVARWNKCNQSLALWYAALKLSQRAFARTICSRIPDGETGPFYVSYPFPDISIARTVSSSPWNLIPPALTPFLFYCFRFSKQWPATHFSFSARHTEPTAIAKSPITNVANDCRPLYVCRVKLLLLSDSREYCVQALGSSAHIEGDRPCILMTPLDGRILEPRNRLSIDYSHSVSWRLQLYPSLIIVSFNFIINITSIIIYALTQFQILEQVRS